jgi:hypothetical protein
MKLEHELGEPFAVDQIQPPLRHAPFKAPLLHGTEGR